MLKINSARSLFPSQGNCQYESVVCDNNGSVLDGLPMHRIRSDRCRVSSGNKQPQEDCGEKAGTGGGMRKCSSCADMSVEGQQVEAWRQTRAIRNDDAVCADDGPATLLPEAKAVAAQCSE